MTSFVTVLLVASLAALIVAHIALVIGLAQLQPRVWWRPLLAILLPPLAPYWGTRHGLRLRTYAWLAAIALYALGVAIV
jgi:cell shape-determining protein MreD